MGVSENKGVPYLGVPKRILLFGVLYEDPLFSETLIYITQCQEREEALRELEHAEQRCLQLQLIDRGNGLLLAFLVGSCVGFWKLFRFMVAWGGLYRVVVTGAWGYRGVGFFMGVGIWGYGPSSGSGFWRF